MTFESPFAAALNRLLDAESWARERLAPFAGETLEWRAPPLPALRLRITAEGQLAVPEGADASSAPASLTMTAGPGAFAAALKGEEQLMRAIDVAGNARLAQEVMFLFRHLRWDAEEELAALVGDAAAHRLAGFARGALAWHADATRRVAESLVEYAVEERPLLVRRGELEEIAELQARLRDGLDRLEKRIVRLGG